MKYLALFAFLSMGAFAVAEEGTKYICSIGDMEDAVFTEVYATKEECHKYCKPRIGAPAICEETGKKTPIDTEEVD